MVPRMSGARHRIACLVAILALAAPQAAFAQGAGDEQYQDPFAGDNGQSDQGDAQGDDQGGADGGQAPDSGSSGSGTSTSPGDATTTQAPTSTTAQTSPAAEQLPRTGNDPFLPAVAGFWLLIGGVALRAKVRVR